jgi:hypothetical protein
MGACYAIGERNVEMELGLELRMMIICDGLQLYSDMAKKGWMNLDDLAEWTRMKMQYDIDSSKHPG